MREATEKVSEVISDFYLLIFFSMENQKYVFLIGSKPSMLWDYSKKATVQLYYFNMHNNIKPLLTREMVSRPRDGSRHYRDNILQL